jgi:hypothetical protein
VPSVLEIATPNDQRALLQNLQPDGNLPSPTDNTKELWHHLRNKARDSLYFFIKGVLGYDLLNVDVHREVCDLTQDLDKRKRGIFMPRGTFKTTLNSIGFPIWVLINDPNQTILLANQVAGNSERFLSEIESHLDGSNPRMNWLFPEYIRPDKKFKPWSDSRMTVPCQTRITGTPSITALGVGAKVESQHFHVIITDDLIGRAALISESVMSDTAMWHDYLLSLFVKPAEGIERMAGTRWSLSDMYEPILGDPEYECIVIPAIDLDSGKSNFPDLLPLDLLDQIKRKNFYHFMSQYMNDPRNPEMLDFQKEWLHYYKLLPSDKGPVCQDDDGGLFYVSDMNLLLMVDPAGSGDIEGNLIEEMRKGKSRRANNAIALVGAHGSGRYYVLDTWAGRGIGENPELQVVTKILEMLQKWQGMNINAYVESYGAQSSLITIFNMVQRDGGTNFQLMETPRGMRNAKSVRIRGAVGGVAQNQDLFMRKGQHQLLYEYESFPQGELKDILDALAWAIILLDMPLGETDLQEVLKEEQAMHNRRMGLGITGY